MAHSALLAWAWALALGAVPGGQAGCAELGRCCPGRDLTCVSRDWAEAAGSSLGAQPCYCDQACSTARDCCPDYWSACPGGSPARMSWEQGGHGRRDLGRGSLGKVRQGRGSTLRVRECRGALEWGRGGKVDPEKCPYHSLLIGWKNVPALITTGAFRNGRKKRALAHERKSTGYCVMFQLVTIAVGCLQTRAPYTQWMRYLTQGHTVCVLCEPPALDMKSLRCYGDGKGSRGDQLLQWQAVGNPSCRGTWKRFQQLEACSCPAVHNFLFV
ncbi:somatomedin-B and thrombospondin type-1 domain-containing protein-like [Gracilinanus agilis]|uniref:somatomedin-B and thrombospondin type-1 domain-containing protein-like n=1 Tax=Gracilinanus agilis TaxID=191870 RepID=UPI001CFCA5D5|nr:somatomedin-B and thrombospondin type-1 domain-containing protein-like [Gracilinanus agilis]